MTFRSHRSTRAHGRRFRTHAVLALVLLPLAVAGAAPPLVYDFAIASVSPPVVAVTFSYTPDGTGDVDFAFPVDQGTLARSPYEFCRQVQAWDAAGRVLTATFVAEDAVIRVSDASGPVTLSYAVVLYHAFNNLVMPADVPLISASGAVFPGRSVLLHPVGAATAEAEMRLQLPEGWTALAAWPMERNDGEARFTAPIDEVERSFLYMGRAAGREFEVGGATVALVNLAGQEDAEWPIGEWTQRLLLEEQRIFRTMPAARMLVVVSPRSLSPFPRTPEKLFGSARSNAIHLLAPHPEETEADGDTRPRLLRQLALELINVWAGAVTSRSQDVGMAYFQAGLADYSAILSLLRAGLIDEEQFLTYLSWSVEDYVNNPLAADVPVLDGANHPSLADESRGLRMMGLNLALTGGRLAGLLFDVRIRQQSGDGKSLDTLWAASVERLGEGEPYNREAYFQLLSETTLLDDPQGMLTSTPLRLDAPLAAAGMRIMTTTTSEAAMNVYFDVNSSTPEIKWVMPGAAQSAGLVRGDTILRVGRAPVPDLRVFDWFLRKAGPGETVDLRVRSASGEERDVKVHLAARTKQRVERVQDPTPEQQRLWQAMTSGGGQ